MRVLALLALLVPMPGFATAGERYDPVARRPVRQPPPYLYDTGGDNDRRPDLPRWQQGGGQQTGGPARNLIPGDSIHIAPR